MGASAFQLRIAKQSGEALVRGLQIASLPVDPFLIADKHDILVDPKPDSDEGVSGMLLRHGDMFCILYATHIPSEGFQRFSVAHELGHYFLEGHIDCVLKDDHPHMSQAGFTSSDPYEQEADQFAAGMLMPEDLFGKEMRMREPSLRSIEELAGIGRTSLTATALRYAELSRDPLAVILSTGPTIDFCKLSEPMKALSNFNWLKKATPVPVRTLTARFNAAPDRVTLAEQETFEMDVCDWLGGDKSIRCLEEVVGLGRYGKTLTVLTCEVSEGEDDPEDEGHEETMVEHWERRNLREDL